MKARTARGDRSGLFGLGFGLGFVLGGQLAMLHVDDVVFLKANALAFDGDNYAAAEGGRARFVFLVCTVSVASQAVLHIV